MSWSTRNAPRFQPSGGLGTAVKILLAVVGVLGLADSIEFRRLTQRMAFQMTLYRGGGSSPLNLPSTAIGGFAFLSWLALVIVWLIWQHRVTANTAAAGRPSQTSPGWAVAWWFVPLANLFMPAVAMHHLNKASRGDDSTGTLLIVGWWLTWVGVSTVAVVAMAAGFLSPIVDGAQRLANTNQSAMVDLTHAVQTFGTWRLVASVSQLIAALLAILIVQRIESAQKSMQSMPVGQPIPMRPDIGY